MDIGTPLSASSTRVMLLGAGELGKEVIISFQRLGVEVVAVDRYQNAPGHQVAHRAYVIDMTDEKKLRQIIQKEKPHYIVPEIEAINTDFLSEVDSEDYSKIIPSLKAVQLTMNREGIRKLASEELGLPTSNYGFARSYEELKDLILNKIKFPCFIKPTMSSSGKGQSLIKSESEIESAWKFAATGGRVDQGVVIAEGLIDFDYEMNGGFSTPLATDLNLMSLKNACYTCPMFEICNGCKKTIKDLKQHNMVEDHCEHMKTLASDIISINSINRQLTPYEREYA